MPDLPTGTVTFLFADAALAEGRKMTWQQAAAYAVSDELITRG